MTVVHLQCDNEITWRIDMKLLGNQKVPDIHWAVNGHISYGFLTLANLVYDWKSNRMFAKLTKTTCGDACYKASSNVHIETEVEMFYLHSYFYFWVSVHVHYSDFSIMVFISNKAIECYALFTFSTIIQHYSFVLTSIDSKWTFGFCRHDPKTETALVLLSYLPWHESFYKWVSVLQ